MLVVLLLKALNELLSFFGIGHLCFLVFLVRDLIGNFAASILRVFDELRALDISLSLALANDCLRITWIVRRLLLTTTNKVVSHWRYIRLLHLAVLCAFMWQGLLHVQRTTVLFASHPRSWDIRTSPVNFACQLLGRFTVHQRHSETHITFHSLVLELVEQVEYIAP